MDKERTISETWLSDKNRNECQTLQEEMATNGERIWAIDKHAREKSNKRNRKIRQNSWVQSNFWYGKNWDSNIARVEDEVHRRMM